MATVSLYVGMTNTELAIDAADGTAIGDMTLAGGLGAAFDGETAETATTSAARVDTGYMGKDWGAGVYRTITKAVVTGSSDAGFYGSNPNITLNLYGSNSNDISGAVLLGTEGPAADANAGVMTVTDGRNCKQRSIEKLAA